MIATATLRTIVLALFGLSLIWVVKIVVKREFETLFRALVVTALIGGAFLYLQETKHTSISWKIIKNDIFPSTAQPYTFLKEEGRMGGPFLVRYLFPKPGPRGVRSRPQPEAQADARSQRAELSHHGRRAR